MDSIPVLLIIFPVARMLWYVTVPYPHKCQMNQKCVFGNKENVCKYLIQQAKCISLRKILMEINIEISCFLYCIGRRPSAIIDTENFIGIFSIRIKFTS
jgi:predicted DNA-binding helix-hairpin-helix protein